MIIILDLNMNKLKIAFYLTAELAIDVIKGFKRILNLIFIVFVVVMVLSTNKNVWLVGRY